MVNKKIFLLIIIFCFVLLISCAVEQTQQKQSITPQKNNVSVVLEEQLTPEEKKSLEENLPRAEPLDKEYVSLENKTK